MQQPHYINEWAYTPTKIPYYSKSEDEKIYLDKLGSYEPAFGALVFSAEQSALLASPDGYLSAVWAGELHSLLLGGDLLATGDTRRHPSDPSRFITS